MCGDVGDYEKDLPWYQWTAEISSERMAALLSNYAGKDLGTLESVEVTRRGDGDVAAELDGRLEPEGVLRWRQRIRFGQALEEAVFDRKK